MGSVLVANVNGQQLGIVIFINVIVVRMEKNITANFANPTNVKCVQEQHMGINSVGSIAAW